MFNRNILVLGGTGYFGKHLVKMLLTHGDRVTIATRGVNQIPQGCSFIHFDRNKDSDIVLINNWDIIFDQSGYSSDSLNNLINIIPRCGKYIFTSSQAIYPPNLAIEEESLEHHCFDNYKQIINDYGMEKLKAESFIKNLTSRYIFPRFPVVVGLNDPRQRVQTLIDKILSRAIYLPASNPLLQMLDEFNAAQTLFDLSFKQFTGAINIASEDNISVENLCYMIAQHFNIELNITWSQNYKASPYDLVKLESKTLATKKQCVLGLQTNPITAIINNLVKNSKLMEINNVGLKI